MVQTTVFASIIPNWLTSVGRKRKIKKKKKFHNDYRNMRWQTLPNCLTFLQMDAPTQVTNLTRIKKKTIENDKSCGANHIRCWVTLTTSAKYFAMAWNEKETKKKVFKNTKQKITMNLWKSTSQMHHARVEVSKSKQRSATSIDSFLFDCYEIR